MGLSRGEGHQCEDDNGGGNNAVHGIVALQSRKQSGSREGAEPERPKKQSISSSPQFAVTGNQGKQREQRAGGNAEGTSADQDTMNQWSRPNIPQACAHGIDHTVAARCLRYYALPAVEEEDHAEETGGV